MAPATATSVEGLENSMHAASRFLDRIEALDADARARIPTDAFGTAKHTGALMGTADEITMLKRKDVQDRVGQFLVPAELRVENMQLSPQLESLVKAAVRAIVVSPLPDRAAATKQLYGPFEGVIPFESLKQ